MKLIATTLVLLTALSVLASANPEDAPTMFLHAYTVTQKAERFAQDGHEAEALRSYNEADAILAAIRKEHPDWQPLIVEYRRGRIARAISQPNSKFFLGVQHNCPPLPGQNGRGNVSIFSTVLVIVAALCFWFVVRLQTSKLNDTEMLSRAKQDIKSARIVVIICAVGLPFAAHPGLAPLNYLALGGLAGLLWFTGILLSWRWRNKRLSSIGVVIICVGHWCAVSVVKHESFADVCQWTIVAALAAFIIPAVFGSRLFRICRTPRSELIK